MSDIFEGNFRILIKYLQRMQTALSKQGATYSPNDGGSIDKIGKAISSLHDLKRIPPSENVPASGHFQVNHQWIDAALEDIFAFNSRGDEYICSTVEAVIKCNGIKRLFDGFTKPLYFRGEHNFGWELISRAGRKLTIDWDSTDPLSVTDIERKLLSDFQIRCQKDTDLKEVVFGVGKPLPDDHPGWWSLMQHYDTEYGTRMIDVTTSLYCALYFGCADWDGSVDSRIDGKLYMFPHSPGRGETNSPDRIKGTLVGPEDERQENLITYFTIESHPEIPRFRVSPARNDRALSQDGYFVWQAFFDQPLYTFQIFPFRIHRDFKHSILSELAAMGYTKERILAENRYGI